jgi:GMP synthase (glutamine-hydrolysing)
MIPHIVAFRHVPNEPLGFFEICMDEKNIPFEYLNLYETNEIPSIINASHLIFLGGPMSVNDENEFPWLIQEKELIRRSVKTGQKVLGICLGAQLIASAHGAKVFPCLNETGWKMLTRDNDAPGIFSEFPVQFPVFQLHGETFEIPDGGRLLAHGDAVRNQAFSCQNALGLQFHLELTGEIIRAWSKDLPGVEQSKITSETPCFLAESNLLCRMVAEDFIR